MNAHELTLAVSRIYAQMQSDKQWYLTVEGAISDHASKLDHCEGRLNFTSGLLGNVKDLAGGTFQEVAGIKGQIGASMAQIVGNDTNIKMRLDKCESDLREVICCRDSPR